MINNLHTRYFYLMPVWLLTLLLAQLLTGTTAQASSLAVVLPQKDPHCRISVPAGWRPYRVQSADTLEALVVQANVGLEAAMQVNCLTTATIKADELLLLPARSTIKPAAPIVAEQPVAPAAPATSATAPVAAAQSLLTVISTTATPATAPVVAPAISKATTDNEGSAPAGPFTAANVIVIALFVLGGLAAFFFALRPRADDAAVVRNLFSTVGNAIFLFAGVLIGVILFPLAPTTSFTALPTGMSASIVVTLIALLVAKEVFFSGRHWRTLNRLLNLGIAPLLMIFFLTVATRVAEMIN